MGPLTTLSISLLALKLGGVSDVGYGLIIIPVALEHIANFVIAYRKYRALNKIIKEVQDSMDENNKE